MLKIGSIVRKWQKCGKKPIPEANIKGCICYEGKLHGPYYHLVCYKGMKLNSKFKMAKTYSWKYLGKDPSKAILLLKELNLDKELSKKLIADLSLDIPQEDYLDKLEELAHKTLKEFQEQKQQQEKIEKLKINSISEGIKTLLKELEKRGITPPPS